MLVETSLKSLEDVFGPVISTCTVNQAIEDGHLVNARMQSLGTCADEVFGPDLVVAFTPKLWALIEKAVANKRHCNDYQGVVWDILYMSKFGRPLKGGSEDERYWQVIITGAARQKNFVMKGVYQAASVDGGIALVIDVTDLRVN